MTTRMTHEDLCTVAAQHSTDAQAVALVKMLKMGWTITKVATDKQSGKAAIALCLGQTQAWLMPSASVKRAAVGRSSAAEAARVVIAAAEGRS